MTLIKNTDLNVKQLVQAILACCRYWHVILHPSPLIASPSSHCSVSFLPCSLPLAFQLNLFGFSQKEKGFKPKCSWEKPKESGWRAKRREQKRKDGQKGPEVQNKSWRSIQWETNITKTLNNYYKYLLKSNQKIPTNRLIEQILNFQYCIKRQRKIYISIKKSVDCFI